METEERRVNEFLDDLQDWQKEILKMEDISQFHMRGEDEVFPITKAQADMLEKVLGNDFYIQDGKVREILEAVYFKGFYYERDREVLNWARECYLKGMNWIKKKNV